MRMLGWKLAGLSERTAPSTASRNRWSSSSPTAAPEIAVGKAIEPGGGRLDAAGDLLELRRRLRFLGDVHQQRIRPRDLRLQRIARGYQIFDVGVERAV